MIDRALKAILLLCAAGLIVAVSMLVTAAAGVVAGSDGPSIPAPFLGLFYLLWGVFGIAGAWVVARLGAQR
ncbi:hypothetical protein ABH930_000314 [Kitasatospora sp. GAS204A]|uniref:hypothetical protein n=1 Tax=unclassified Kitasatospora TaxID=2633591 RepID=UPI0024737917|nr:hypothetical protein [Kitasatospora sp. GAS204B]MDH6116895.1 hypothetical protein [Kitasatospora sp. GAS204B]